MSSNYKYLIPFNPELLSTSPQYRIQPAPNRPLPTSTFTGTIKLKGISGDKLDPCFEDVEEPPNCGCLDINITDQDRVVQIFLDKSNCDWEFTPQDGVTLVDPNSGLYYANLRYLPPDPMTNRRLGVSFEAKWAYPSEPPNHPDGYNLNVIVYSGPNGEVYPNGKLFTIDPDIKNPGTDALIGP